MDAIDVIMILIAVIVIIVVAVIAAGMINGLKTELREIHIMVNSRMNETLNRIDQLTKALNDAGIKVPENPEREDS